MGSHLRAVPLSATRRSSRVTSSRILFRVMTALVHARRVEYRAPTHPSPQVRNAGAAWQPWHILTVASLRDTTLLRSWKKEDISGCFVLACNRKLSSFLIGLPSVCLILLSYMLTLASSYISNTRYSPSYLPGCPSLYLL